MRWSSFRKEDGFMPQKRRFDVVIFKGVGIVEKRGRKNALVIYSSKGDAIKRGVSKKIAAALFAGDIAAGGDCAVDFGWFGSVSCDNVSCSGTCTLQVNKLDGQGWNDAGSASAVANPNWAYRCVC